MSSRSTPLSRLVATLLALTLSACASSPPSGGQPQASETATPSRTPVPPTATPAATDTPTPIPLSATDREDVLHAFQVMTLAEVSAEITLKGAKVVQAEGETSTFAESIKILGAYMFANLASQEIQKVTPPLTLRPFWDDMVAAFNDMTALINQWSDEKIEASDVEADMLDVTERIRSSVDNAQTALILLYGWDADELETTRRDTLKAAEGMYATETPTP